MKVIYGCTNVGDYQIVHSGNYSAYLKSMDEKVRDFATLIQQIKSNHYRGERLQFSAFIKNEDVKGSAGLKTNNLATNIKIISIDKYYPFFHKLARLSHKG